MNPSPGIPGTIAQLARHTTRRLRNAWHTLTHSACCSVPR